MKNRDITSNNHLASAREVWQFGKDREMMRTGFGVTIAALALALALTACSGGSGDAPQGQVVATVDGMEITVAQLNNELLSIGADANVSEAVRREALQRLIVRRLLLAEAKRRKLDKKPATSIAVEQAEELALVQALAIDFGSGVPKISNDEVEEFIRDNPANTTRRKLLFVDQLYVPAANENFFKELAPIKRIDDAEALLKKNNIPFRRAAAVVDTQGLDPREAARIVELGQSDIFYTRNGNSAQISGVVTSREVPLLGTAATHAARSRLANQRTTAHVQAQMADVVKGAKGRVMVNPAYGGKGALPGQ